MLADDEHLQPSYKNGSSSLMKIPGFEVMKGGGTSRLGLTALSIVS